MDTRALLTTAQWGDVTATVVGNNPGMNARTARRIVGEGLKFVTAAAQFPGIAIAPSRVVDEGWHALILHTALYANLCDRMGVFVHHYPERPDPKRHDDGVLARTTALIKEAGHTVDRALWTAPAEEIVAVAADCSHTPVPGGCGPIGPNPGPGGRSSA